VRVRGFLDPAKNTSALNYLEPILSRLQTPALISRGASRVS